MRLADNLIDKVKKAGVQVYYADRRITSLWNRERDEGDPVQFGGWYWHRKRGNVVVDTDADGPFRSQMAAIRDAWKKLQIR